MGHVARMPPARPLTAGVAAAVLAGVALAVFAAPGSARASTGSSASAPTAPLALQAWAGTSLDGQIQALGPGNETTRPPDPGIAVGDDWVVETTESALFVSRRDGSAYPDRPGAVCPPPGPTWQSYTRYSLGGCDRVDLDNFVSSDGWTPSASSVTYDPGARQFYLTLSLHAQPTPSQSCASGSPAGDACSVVLVLHTTSGDPTGQWAAQVLRPHYYGVIAVRPRLGFSADKVAVAWDEESPAGVWYGDSVVVMSKALFLAGAAQPVIAPAGGTSASPETGHFGLFPATDLGSGDTLYMVANDSAGDLLPGAGPDLYVQAVTGSTASTVQESAADLPLGDHSASPPPAVEEGTTNLIATGDDGIRGAVWSDGTLWTGFDESCTPTGDTQARACIHYVEVSTGSMEITDQTTLGLTGLYAYYPTFGIDPQGDLLSTFTESGAELDPSVAAVGIPSGQTSLSAPITVIRGAGPYWYETSSSSSTPCASSCVFGDTAGGAMDPLHPADLWFADEAQTDAADPADWGTVVGRVTYAAPDISAITPSVGPTVGGTAVTVSGSDFGPGTTFSLGGSALSVSDLTPDSFTVTAPAHAAGAVTGVATDSLGSSRASPYLYVAPSRYQPLTPYRVLDTRSATCVQCGGGALGDGETRSIPVAGYTPPGYTGATVPADAIAVVLNVTAVSGSRDTYLTVFPAGGGVPTASNLNPAPGQTIANLVTVAVGAAGEVSIHNAAGSIEVVADVEGYYESAAGASGELHAESPPVRVCDTRGGHATPCSSGAAEPLLSGQSRLVAVADGATGVVTGGDAEAVVLNLTAASGTALTYLSVYPPTPSQIGPPVCGPPPLVSNLNVPAHTDRPNRVITPVVGYQGTAYACVHNAQGTINAVIDVDGWFGNGDDSGGALFYPLGPTRICDTRYTQGTQCAGDTLQPGEALPVQAEGTGPLPTSGVIALVANFTAVSGSAATYLSVYPDAMFPPGTSDLNPSAHTTIANLVMVAVAADGRVDVYNAAGTIDCILDVVGWFQ